MTLRSRQRLTYLAWGLSAAGALTLWGRNTPERGSIPGVVESARHAFGPAEAGRITGVFVRAGDRVRPGDALLQFATDQIDTELDVERGVYEEVLAEAEAVASRAQDEVRERRRSMVAELARARAALAAARGSEAANRAEISSLREQLARLDGVVRDGLAEADRVGGLRARQASLTEASRHAPDILQAWAGLAAQVDTALGRIPDAEVAAQVKPLRARLETQSVRISGLIERRARATLRAPSEGQVTEVLRRSGDAVGAGETVVYLMGATSGRIVAYAPEEVARAFSPGGLITARPRARGYEVSGTIRAIGTEVVEMPAHLWSLPDRPRYGLPIYIELRRNASNESTLFAGEALSVAMQSGAGGAVAAVQSDHAPPILALPPALREQTRFEGSGMVYVPEWQRFLAVSDDTGLADAETSPAWVFTLDAARGLDPEPISIQGMSTVSDLESLTRADDGTLYLLASQSLSQKGRRPAKRQVLVHVAIESEPRGLRVLESIPLYDTLSPALSPELREALGFGALLDIEGMTYFEGGLLLGLKAPQDDVGRARLLRLRLAPGEKRLASVEAEPYRTISLPTCSLQAPGGISDLFLSKDTLFLTSTLPEGPACGSAWRLDLSSMTSTPIKLEDFEGYKPEGIARDGAGRLQVLFDTGDDAPRLTTLTETKP